MSTRTGSADGVTESCDVCEHDTTHSVSIELRTESGKTENAEFSREPYRVSECMICGDETALRMNNA